MRHHEMYNKSSTLRIVMHGSRQEMHNKSSKSRIAIHGSGLKMHNKSSKSRIVIHGSGLGMYNKSSKLRIVIRGSGQEGGVFCNPKQASNPDLQFNPPIQAVSVLYKSKKVYRKPRLPSRKTHIASWKTT